MRRSPVRVRPLAPLKEQVRVINRSDLSFCLMVKTSKMGQNEVKRARFLPFLAASSRIQRNSRLAIDTNAQF